jgi:phage internal scaffolding protein
MKAAQGSKKVKIHSAYDVPEHEGLLCEDPSLAQRQFQDATDVNQIVYKHQKLGLGPQFGDVGEPVYADISEVPDLLAAHQIVEAAQEAFMRLPAQVRKKIDNDPARLVEYLEDPANMDEAVKLGLIMARAEKVSETPPPSQPAGDQQKKS